MRGMCPENPALLFPPSLVGPVLTAVRCPRLSGDRAALCGPNSSYGPVRGKIPSIRSGDKRNRAGDPGHSHLGLGPPLEWELENEIKSSDLLSHAERKIGTRD